MDLDAMVYGNVEDDPELLAELMMLAGDDADAQEPKPRAQMQAGTSGGQPKQTRQTAYKPAAVNFDEIHKLARQISVDATIDPNAADDDYDDDLMDELSELVGTTTAPPPPAPQRQPPPTTSVTPLRSPSTAVQPTTNPFEMDTTPPPVPTRKDVTPAPPTTTEAPLKPQPPPKPQPVPQPPRQIPQPQPAAPSTTSTARKGPMSVKDALQQRLQIYQTSVTKCRESGDDRRARQNERIVKQFETALKQMARGKTVDVADLPCPAGCSPIDGGTSSLSAPPPPLHGSQSAAAAIGRPTSLEPSSTLTREQLMAAALEQKKLGNMDIAKQLLMRAKQIAPAPSAKSPISVPQAVAPKRSASPNAPRRSRSQSPGRQAVSSSDLAVELRNRRAFFLHLRDQSQNDERRVRQCTRIIAEYNEAMNACAAGRPYAYEELAEPPEKKGTGLPSSVKPRSRTPQPTTTTTPPKASPSASSTGGPTPPKQSKAEEKVNFLLHRQAQFKQVALIAKQRGDIDAAKRFLLQAKGFDGMIEGARNGVRVDISNTPVPPQATTSRHVLKPQLSVHQSSSSSTSVVHKRDEVLSTLEADFIKQIQTCEQSQEYFTRTGSIAEVSRFEALAADCRKDLLTLRNYAQHYGRPPPFQYVNRELPQLQCNTDLSEEHLELAILRATTVCLPDGYDEEDGDLFITYKFDYPDTAHQKGQTDRVKASISPVFNMRCKLKINIQSRQFLRHIKRRGIKFEVWQRVGMLRSDRSVGTCEIMLAELETKATLHKSLDLLNGRRPCGGRLEVKARIRQPLVQTSTTNVTHKWLVLKTEHGEF